MESTGVKRKYEDDSYLDLSITQITRRSKPSRKLRRLNQEFTIGSPKVQNRRVVWGFLGIAGASFMLILFLSKFDEIKRDFLQHYEQQYNKFMDQTSCAELSINGQEIMQALKRQLVGQADALHDIEATLSNSGNFSGMALMGSSGLGKSLTAQIIFDTSQLASKLYMVMDDHLRNNETWRIVNRLKVCGENLLIIDDIAPSDWPAIRHLVHKLERSAYRTFAVFIFHVSRYTANHDLQYSSNINALRRHLPPKIRVIEFRMLEKPDLDIIIDKTSESLVGFRLSDSQKQRVIGSVDLERHGVKTVRAKVSLEVY